MKPQMQSDPFGARATGPLVPRESDAGRNSVWARLLEALLASRGPSPQDNDTNDPRERLPLPIIPF
jgi:hypothetical protein